MARPTTSAGAVRKVCPQHGERDQHGIYCNAAMGSRLSCGERLEIYEPPEGCEDETSERPSQ